ncbi:MAG: DNA repair protein RadC [Deltaproteobacteria bacterium]|nr:DNA repair protein RadC [Deltaproteobacteria bacterium]
MASMNDHSHHYLEHRQRLKKKYIDAGIDAFHDYESLELLLSYAIPRKDIKPLAKNLLTAFGSIKGVMDADITDLKQIRGIGLHTALLIKIVKDILKLYLKDRAKDSPQISSTSDLLNYLKIAMGGLKDEQFRVIYLDSQNKIIDIEILQEGIVNQAVVYPRKVVENALKQKASALILVHNHPSGFLKPSEADIRLTKIIKETAKMLDILIHDHIIIGENRFFSFREDGIL